MHTDVSTCLLVTTVVVTLAVFLYFLCKCWDVCRGRLRRENSTSEDYKSKETTTPSSPNHHNHGYSPTSSPASNHELFNIKFKFRSSRPHRRKHNSGEAMAKLTSFTDSVMDLTPSTQGHENNPRIPAICPENFHTLPQCHGDNTMQSSLSPESFSSMNSPTFQRCPVPPLPDRHANALLPKAKTNLGHCEVTEACQGVKVHPCVPIEENYYDVPSRLIIPVPAVSCCDHQNVPAGECKDGEEKPEEYEKAKEDMEEGDG